MQLENENVRLFHELCQWKDKATADSRGKRLVEEENGRLHLSNQELERRVQDYSDTASYLTSRITRCFQGLDKVLPILEDLKMEVEVEISTG